MRLCCSWYYSSCEHFIFYLFHAASGPFPASIPWLIFSLCFLSNVLPLTTANYSFHSCLSWLTVCLLGKPQITLLRRRQRQGRARKKDVKDNRKANTSVMVFYSENIDSKLKGSVGSEVSAQLERERERASTNLLHQNINC